jgi:hypothetical protein
MSTAHRQHTFDIPAHPAPIAQVPVRSDDADGIRAAHPALIAVLLLVAAGAAAAVLTVMPRVGDSPTDAPAVATPRTIVTTPLPAASDTGPRFLHERLQIWRAGYEAAIQNGCQLTVPLTSPVSASR